MSEEKPLVFTRTASGLVKEFGPWDVIMMSWATPIAGGLLFFGVATATSFAGQSLIVGYIICGLFFVIMAATMGCLTSAMPRAGGMYVAISRLLSPLVSYLVNWLWMVGCGFAIGLIGFIATGVIGGAISIYGFTAGIPSLVDTGGWLATVEAQSIGGVVFTLFFWFISLMGARATKRVMWVLFLIPIVTTAIGLIYLLISGPTGIGSAFDSFWGAGTYKTIIDTATAHGWSPVMFSTPNAADAILAAIWAYTAFEIMTFAAGETKTPKKSLILGIPMGTLFATAMCAIVAFAVYYPYGDFVSAYDFLFFNYRDELSAMMPPVSPSVPFFASCATRSPLLGVIINLGMSFWFINSIPGIFLGVSRNFFAFSFDRAVPERFSDVDKRGTPRLAIHVAGIFGLLGVINMWQGLGSILGILNLEMVFIFVFLGLAAISFPYIRRDLFEASPITWHFVGIPVITILGFATLALDFFLVLLSAMALTKEMVLAFIGVCVVGLIIYVAQQSKNVKEGIAVDKIYATIPPE